MTCKCDVLKRRDVAGGYLDIPAVKTVGFKMIDAFET